MFNKKQWEIGKERKGEMDMAQNVREGFVEKPV